MNILITSIGRRSYMVDYFKSVLKKDGLVHAANSEMTYAMSLADRHLITPNIYDGLYIDFVLNYSIENDIKLIITLFDIDLPILSKNKKRFEKHGIQVIVSSPEVTEMCNDKWKTYNFLLKNEINTPLSFIELNKCEQTLSEGGVSFPLIIKPRWGMGSIGVFQADNHEELTVLYSKVKRTIESTYLKYESQIDINYSVIIQEKLLGAEHGLDIFNDFSGEYICSVPKKKIAMRAGETDVAEVISSFKLESLAKNLSSKVKHIANLDVDCFINGEEIYVLEMNARFGGQYPFSHLAGVNFPKMIIDLATNEVVDSLDYEFKSNTRGFKDIVIREII